MTNFFGKIDLGLVHNSGGLQRADATMRSFKQRAGCARAV
jgi:hypothetical protein